MTPADIEAAISDYGPAAAQARAAGFDGVEIAANGTSLIPQFLNPRLNRRTDGYGVQRHRSSLRCRRLDGGGSACGCRRTGRRLTAPPQAPLMAATLTPLTSRPSPVMTRSWPAERTPAGLPPRARPRPAAPGAVPDFDAIARDRTLFGGPLIANHGFGWAACNAIVAAGIADAVSFGRLFIANPDLVSRFALGHALAASNRALTTAAGPAATRTTRSGRRPR